VCRTRNQGAGVAGVVWGNLLSTDCRYGTVGVCGGGLRRAGSTLVSVYRSHVKRLRVAGDPVM